MRLAPRFLRIATALAGVLAGGACGNGMILDVPSQSDAPRFDADPAAPDAPVYDADPLAPDAPVYDADPLAPDAALTPPDAPPAPPDASPPSPDANGCTDGVVPCRWLAAHNSARCNVDPPAARMPRVTWDPALVCPAQQWADGCPVPGASAHNSDRTSMYQACGGTASYVGENIAWGYGSLESVVLEGWVADEVIYYDFATNSCDAGEVCGHYTQVVWADSVTLGCATAQVSCPDWGTAVYVCNYAPGGNYVGERPYEQGTGPNDSCE